MSLWIATLVPLAAPAAAELAVLREIRPILSPDYGRLVIDLTRPVPYELRVQPGNDAAGVPARLYVDLRETRLPGGSLSLSPPGSPLVRMRAVQASHDVVRILLDVPGLRDPLAFPLLDPFRLVIDVRGHPRPMVAPKQVVLALRPPTSGRVATPRMLSPEPPLKSGTTPRRLKVVLDAGHGGRDPGATGVGGGVEKDVVLAVTRSLGVRLEEAGYAVFLTRDRDIYLSLEERTAYANAVKADLFVSIHANASRNRSASGIETYYLSNTEDRATVRLARMENQLAHMTGRHSGPSDVSWIVSDMIQSFKVEESFAFAKGVQRALLGQARRVHPMVRDLGVKPGPFYVLVGAGMPAILAELSFLSHPEEGRRLLDESYQEALSEGLLRGIRQFGDNDLLSSGL